MNSNSLNKKKLYSHCESNLGDRDGSQLDLFFWEVLIPIIQNFQVKVFNYKETGHFQGLNTSRKFGKVDCP